MRSEKLYLLDIVEAADAIQRFIQPITEEDFLKDELRQSAVLQKLIIIGEAASRLPRPFQQKYSEIQWEDVIGFRNIAVPEYFAILWTIVWATAVNDVPYLNSEVMKILEAEFKGE
jgi:uncharacterized protein with HEPN domain